MSYVLLTENGTVSKYPYSVGQLRIDNPNVSFSASPPASLLAEWRVFPVARVPQPDNTATTDFVAADPVLVNGVWTQVWQEVPATAEEIQRRADAAFDTNTKQNVKADDFVSTFIAMTPAQVALFFAGNFPSLTAVERTRLSKLALMLLLLARKEYR